MWDYSYHDYASYSLFFASTKDAEPDLVSTAFQN